LHCFKWQGTEHMMAIRYSYQEHNKGRWLHVGQIRKMWILLHIPVWTFWQKYVTFVSSSIFSFAKVLK
jgi:hypothetical protein